MRTIYVDGDYKCHVSNDTSDYIAVDTDFFDGKCDQFIEGYRFIPKDCEWVDTTGKTFKGLMAVPWKPFEELDKTQLEYEYNLLSEYSSAMSEIEVAISAPEVYGTMSTIVEVRKQGITDRINEIINILSASTSV